MRKFLSVAAGLSLLALAACDQAPGNGPQAAAGASARTASVSSESAAPTPQTAYRIARVAPVIRDGADLGWFRAGEGSPRDVGAFVGSAVIDGLKDVFTGPRPVSLEVDVRQFRPAMDLQFERPDAVHRVKLDFAFVDQATGEEVARVDSLFMDLIALTGSAAMIAESAGRSPEVRLSERIAQITAAWARDASCAGFSCPKPVAVAAAAPQPEPVPAPVAAEAPAPEVVKAPEPAPASAAPATETAEAPSPTAPAPSATPAEDADEEPESLFAALAAILEEGAPKEAEPAPVAAPAPAPAAEAPATEEAIAAAPAAEDKESTGGGSLFSRLFGDDEPETSPAGETAAADEPAETDTAAEAVPAPVPAPSPAPLPVPETEVAAAPEVAPIVVRETAPSQTAQPPTAAETPAPDAGSPFFRSPAGTVPTLPQQALLGRSQRQNDPLRQRPGDVVLEISNLPAFWDGDETTGGVWVALPYVPAFRRAVVTNPANGRTVEANLFWRDPQSGGGSTLLSSAAAQALGVTPGQVASLGVKVVAAD